MIIDQKCQKKPKLSQSVQLDFEANNKRNEPDFQNLAEKSQVRYQPCMKSEQLWSFIRIQILLSKSGMLYVRK